jgi:hypothetical protein
MLCKKDAPAAESAPRAGCNAKLQATWPEAGRYNGREGIFRQQEQAMNERVKLVASVNAFFMAELSCPALRAKEW